MTLSKPIRITAEPKPHPDLRKLARALLLLVEQQRAAEPAAPPEKRKAS